MAKSPLSLDEYYMNVILMKYYTIKTALKKLKTIIILGAIVLL